MAISVFITSYNQKAFLKEAIDSVLSQTLMPDELIIIDDASTDHSRDLISDYRSRYPELIKCKFHSVNTGISQSRTDALRMVTSSYVTYLDGDDRFLPEKLEMEYQLFRENKDLSLVFSNNEHVNQDCSKSLRKWINGENVPVGSIFNKVFARRFPMRILFRMEMVKYDTWVKAGFYDPSLKVYEDYDMKMRLAKIAAVGYVDRVLSQYRIHQHGLSKTDIRNHLDALEYIYQKNSFLLDEIPDGDRNEIIKYYFRWYNYNIHAGLTRYLKKADFVSMIKIILKRQKFFNKHNNS